MSGEADSKIGPDAGRHMSAVQLIVLLALIAVGATAVFSAVGYELARRSDERLWSEQHAALRGAVSEFRTLFGRPGEIDPRLIRMMEQSTGVTSLKFEIDPPLGARELQPVLNGDGRIAGFFTWERTQPMTDTVRRIVPYFLCFIAGLAGFAAYAVRQLHRAKQEVAHSAAQARRAADEDKLTGLPNHAKMLELLDVALTEHGDDGLTFALIEVEGMADANAILGPHAGEELYAAVAMRLRETLPKGAICGCIGSSQFAVIMPGSGAEPAIHAALEAIMQPYWLDSAVRVGASAGYAQAPLHAASRGELTRRADLALRAAARRGPGAIAAFESAMDTASAEQRFIRRELPRALSANEFVLHYQPIVRADTGRIAGVEALLRWTHPSYGAVAPAAFIPIAEQMGLMDAIGAFVLRRALQEAKRWPNIYVAVNLSPLQVRDTSLIDRVRSALNDSGVAPSRLVLEITEGVLIEKPEEMLARIEELHALGVRIALDDFGSGYSSLSYLQRFPLDKLKIDRSFVAALGHSANAGVLLQAVIALGRALNLSVLVEGVETGEQRALLRLAGCDEMQGFLFGKPVPAAAIDRLLTARKPRAVSAPQGILEPLTA